MVMLHLALCSQKSISEVSNKKPNVSVAQSDRKSTATLSRIIMHSSPKMNGKSVTVSNDIDKFSPHVDTVNRHDACAP